MKTFFAIFSVFIIFFAGCEPISLEEPKEEYDILGDVLAVVGPDVVAVNFPFTVQVSFAMPCGTTYKSMIVTPDTDRIVFQPILHYVQQDVCPDVVIPPKTISVEVSFPEHGDFRLAAIGSKGNIYKDISVTDDPHYTNSFSLRFNFFDRTGFPKAFRSVNCIFTDREPVEAFSFQTDSNGFWDTTFTASNSEFRYTIGGFPFVAKFGIIEDGVIIVP